MIPVQETLEKLNYLRQHANRYAVFGARPEMGYGHDYILRPVAQESEVVAFERAMGVRIPEDFRDFILQVCNGGPGPGYGMSGLPIRVKKVNDNFQMKAFDPNDAAMDGCLELSNQGCGIYDYLVIHGDPAYYGKVVSENGFGEVFIGPNFWEYYSDWLEDALLVLVGKGRGF